MYKHERMLSKQSKNIKKLFELWNACVFERVFRMRMNVVCLLVSQFSWYANVLIDITVMQTQ